MVAGLAIHKPLEPAKETLRIIDEVRRTSIDNERGEMCLDKSRGWLRPLVREAQQSNVPTDSRGIASPPLNGISAWESSPRRQTCAATAQIGHPYRAKALPQLAKEFRIALIRG